MFEKGKLLLIYQILVLSTVLSEEVENAEQSSRQGRQFGGFNLGSLFQQPARNSQNNNNNNQAPRINLGDLGNLAGSLLNGIAPPRSTKRPDPIGNIINGVVGNVLNRTDIAVGVKDGNLQVQVLPATTQSSIPALPPVNSFPPASNSDCVTVSGSKSNTRCVFPFKFQGKTFNECTLDTAHDNKPWCSTLTDRSGNHITGNWGHCANNCPGVNQGSRPSSSGPVVEGNLAASGLNSIPWIKSVLAGSVKIPGQTDNRIFAFGLNQPNLGHGGCSSTLSSTGDGTCRHLHHCLQPAFFNIVTFISNFCMIQGRYIGVCCPQERTTSAPVTTTTARTSTTTRTTTTTTRPTTVTSASPIISTAQTTATTTQATTVATTTSPNNRRCGTNTKFQTRIVGGKPADPDEWPWLAALLRKGGPGSGQYCGGTLISEQYVITAAHCMEPFKADEVRVKLGEYNFNVLGETQDQTFDVVQVKMHAQYNTETYENDIALLKLDRPVQWTKSVHPICLPARTENFVNNRAYVIGWGTIYFGGPTSDVLQEVNVRVWEQEKCKTNYAKLGRNVLDTMMCAGEEFKDSCQGDSGGPLNCQRGSSWQLCGIVSWGARCAEPEFPGVYTKVTEYLDWIDCNMKDNCNGASRANLKRNRNRNRNRGNGNNRRNNNNRNRNRNRNRRQRNNQE